MVNYINNLPVEIFREIISLSKEDLVDLSKVCKTWQTVLSQMSKNWEEQYIQFLTNKEKLQPEKEIEEREAFKSLFAFNNDGRIAYLALVSIHNMIKNKEGELDFHIQQKKSVLELLKSRGTAYLTEEKVFCIEAHRLFTQTVFSKRDLSKAEELVEEEGKTLRIQVSSRELDDYEKALYAHKLEEEIIELKKDFEITVKNIENKIKKKFDLKKD